VGMKNKWKQRQEQESKGKGRRGAKDERYECVNVPFQCLPGPDHYLKVTESNCFHVIRPVHDGGVRTKR
jgi:hypothetical protein